MRGVEEKDREIETKGKRDICGEIGREGRREREKKTYACERKKSR